MDVIVLSHNLSSNSAGRAYLIADMISNFALVKLIGPAYGDSIWKPIRNSKIKIDAVRYTEYLSTFKKLLRKIDSDNILYCVKPFPMSFGVGLTKKLFGRNCLILDIDDYELGFLMEQGSLAVVLRRAVNLLNPDNLVVSHILSKMTKYCDALSVSSTFLNKIYGGEIIPHARDTDLFNPENFNQNFYKKKLGLAGKKVVLFLGTPRKHKGLEVLISSFKYIKKADVTLVIAGVDNPNKKFLELPTFAKKRSVVLGKQYFTKIPEIISVSDVVVIPQRETLATQGQVPAKLFDAMSMAKPVVSTEVSDIPKILAGGCGIVVKPGQPKAIADSIEYLLTNPKVSKKMGKKARDKCIKHYSYKANIPRLERLLMKCTKSAK